jgi:hypothetical protein
METMMMVMMIAGVSFVLGLMMMTGLQLGREVVLGRVRKKDLGLDMGVYARVAVSAYR